MAVGCPSLAWVALVAVRRGFGFFARWWFFVIKVRPRGNESVQQMLKRFKRLCQREGLIRDMKRHSYYEKPSERKRRQSRKSIRKVGQDGVPPRGR
jgi:small subunit ribosomal protein S21